MASPFEILDEAPRPYLDLIALKEKFLKLSTTVHPDRVHHLSEAEKAEATRRFADLNTAYQTLRDPQKRLPLLIELESGSKPTDVQSTPPEIIDLFMEVGQFCKNVDPYLSRHSTEDTSSIVRATSRILQHDWSVQIKALQEKVDIKREQALLKLQKLDVHWIATEDKKQLLRSLEHLARTFSFLARWSQQLSERSFRLKTI